MLIAGGGGTAAAWANTGAGENPGKMQAAPPPIDKVIKRHAPILMAIPGIVGVAQGQCGDHPCLRVYVIQKTPELEQKIPRTLEGYPVVIEETGEIRPLPEKSKPSKNP